MLPIYVMFTVPARIFYRCVPGFVTECPCGVWCHGLTTSLLYVGPLLVNLVEHDSGFVSLKNNLCFFFHIVSFIS